MVFNSTVYVIPKILQLVVALAEILKCTSIVCLCIVIHKHLIKTKILHRALRLHLNFTSYGAEMVQENLLLLLLLYIVIFSFRLWSTKHKGNLCAHGSLGKLKDVFKNSNTSSLYKLGSIRNSQCSWT